MSDIYPTLCDLLGLEKPTTVEGKSLAPCFEDPATQIRKRLHFAYRGVQRAVKREGMKLIEYVVEGKRATQLFDLAVDPFEVNNLANDPEKADILAALRAELREWRTDFNDTRVIGDRFWGDFDSDEQLGIWRPGGHVHE